MTIDQSNLESPSNTIEALSDATLQEPASSAQALPGPVYKSPFVDPACKKPPTWNCYRCDACGYTNIVCSQLSSHIQKRPGHDPQTVSVSWVGDENVKLAPGFISRETIMARLQWVAGQYRGRKDRKGKAKEAQEQLVDTQRAE
ncbi:hypothetical protein BGX38DRAFT_1277772 [Terfezia claveryi]|nr:hypothetical protein BGX38DRAFT_1277772 [Terfezia claveryi]